MRLGPQVDFVDDGADLPLALACGRYVALGKICLLVPRKPGHVQVGLTCGIAIPSIYSTSTAQSYTTRIHSTCTSTRIYTCAFG